MFRSALVLDSPSRTHTLIRLRGYQAGYRRHGIIANIPPAQHLLDQQGVLGGPGLSGQPFTTDLAERIRDRIAHPIIAAGTAVTLLTGLAPDGFDAFAQVGLTPDRRALIAERTRRSLPRTFTTLEPMAFAFAAFWIPAPVRPLLQAAENFALEHRRSARRNGNDARIRLFPADLFNPALLNYALDRIGAPVPHLVRDLDRIWMTRDPPPQDHHRPPFPHRRRRAVQRRPTLRPHSPRRPDRDPVWTLPGRVTRNDPLSTPRSRPMDVIQADFWR